MKELMGQYQRWKYYLKEKDALKNAIPWITFKAIDYLNANLSREMKVFEFGGGGSTLFFNSRVGELTTVEHDKNWFEALHEEMEHKAKARWQGLFIEPQDKSSPEDLDPANPDDYFSEDQAFRSKTFQTYACAIEAYPDQHFDLVLIDGRARPSCLKHSLAKVKMGGMLVLDNTDREYYLRRFNGKMNNYQLISDHFGPTPYISWFTQTNVWRRII